VTQLHATATGWNVATPRGTVSAEVVIVGTNGYSDNLVPGLRRTVVPAFSSIVASEPLDPGLAGKIMPLGGVLYEAARITTYYRLDSARRLLMGGRGPQRPGVGSGDLAHLTNYAMRLWPDLKSVRWTHAWNGQIALTSDQYPHVHQPQKGLYACVGYNGRGVAFSTVMGAELAALALGKQAIHLPLTPIKPMAMHGLWRVGVTAKLIELRLRDRFGI
jgi:glycine/D-amino acid oxidase-like deaminating enzyme